MIPNGLNTLLGLWLTYVAVLDRAWLAAPWKLLLAGVLVIVLAIWARPGDRLKWASAIDIALGVVLLILAGLQWQAPPSPLLMFWGVFWPGILVAVFALWAALYRSAA